MSAQCSLLLIDDDDEFREIVARRFSRRGNFVVEADSGKSALAVVEQQAFDVVLMDRSLHGQDSFELIPELKRIQPSIRIVVISGHADPQSVAQALAVGASEYLAKPCSLVDMERAVQRACDTTTASS